MMFEGIHLGQVDTFEFLIIVIICVAIITLLAIAAPLNKMIGCTKYGFQGFDGNNVIEGLVGIVANMSQHVVTTCCLLPIFG